MALLDVRDLKIAFYDTTPPTEVVKGISFSLEEGETLGIVGESGSGKTQTALSILHLLKENSAVSGGEILYEDSSVAHASSQDLQRIRGKEISMIFQDPMASLNPRKKVGDIIGEGLDIHHMYHTHEEREQKIKSILAKVGLAPEHASRYPHQFSGGQRQRVGIARALIMNPKLIIADECISALDVSIQAQVVNLMKDIQQETGTAYLFIAHDLSMVKYISDRIGVLHLGHLLETGTTEEIFENPVHPYTRSLLSAIPAPNPIVEKKRIALSYDYKTSGIDYNKGTDHLVSGSHYVKCTDEEFDKWRNQEC